MPTYGPRNQWRDLGQRRRKLVASIARLIDARFAPSDYRFDGSAEWVCERGWKSDGIRLSRIVFSLVISLEVVIPQGTIRDFQSLASTNLGLVAGRGSASYKYPSLFSSDGKFIASIEQDLDAAVDLFREFETPRSSLDRLRKGAPLQPRSDEDPLYYMPPPGSPAYMYCERYLEGLLL